MNKCLTYLIAPLTMIAIVWEIFLIAVFTERTIWQYPIIFTVTLLTAGFGWGLDTYLSVDRKYK